MESCYSKAEEALPLYKDRIIGLIRSVKKCKLKRENSDLNCPVDIQQVMEQ